MVFFCCFQAEARVPGGGVGPPPLKLKFLLEQSQKKLYIAIQKEQPGKQIHLLWVVLV